MRIHVLCSLNTFCGTRRQIDAALEYKLRWRHLIWKLVRRVESIHYNCCCLEYVLTSTVWIRDKNKKETQKEEIWNIVRDWPMGIKGGMAHTGGALWDDLNKILANIVNSTVGFICCCSSHKSQLIDGSPSSNMNWNGKIIHKYHVNVDWVRRNRIELRNGQS